MFNEPSHHALSTALGKIQVALVVSDIVRMAFDGNPANLRHGLQRIRDGLQDGIAARKNSVAIGGKKHLLQNANLGRFDTHQSRTAVTVGIGMGRAGLIRTVIDRIGNGIAIAIRCRTAGTCRIRTRTLRFRTALIAVVEHGIVVVVAIGTTGAFGIGMFAPRCGGTLVLVIEHAVVVGIS